MKKVLSLVLALVMVLGMIPTFAADATGAQALYDNGFITGKDGADIDAKLDVNAQLKRGELAALIAELNGAKDEAAAFEQPADFKDFATTAGWAKNFVSYAVVNGWMNGFTDGTFRADASVPAQQLVAVLMNALGYEVVWNTVLADAAELGIVAEGVALTRGEAFEAMWVAVSEVKMANSDMTLGQHLGKFTPPTPVVTDLKVLSVTADNLIQAVVTFNQAVTAATAEDEDNYSFATADKIEVENASLSADGMMVTLTFKEGVAQQKSANLTVNGIKSVTNIALTKVTTPVTFLDKTIPTIVSAEVVGISKIKVTFSEPMKPASVLAASFKVNDGKFFVKSPVVGQKNNTEYIVELYTSLKTGTLPFEVKVGPVDYAGFTAMGFSTTLNVVEDTTAPTVVSYKEAKPNSVVLVWSEDIALVDGDLDNFYHTNSSNTIAANLTDAAIDGNEMTLTFANAHKLPNGTAYVYVLKDAVKDLWNNKNAQQMTKLDVVVDNTAPVLSSVVVKAENKIQLVFDEILDATDTAKLKSNYTILDKDGKEVTGIISLVDTTTEKKVTLTFVKKLEGGDYTLVVKKVEDLAGNAITSTSLAFTVTDLTAPIAADDFSATLYGYTFTGTSDQILKVSFGQAMAVEGAYSVADLSKYLFNGTELGDVDDVTIAVVDGNKAVEITVPIAELVLSTSGTLQVGRVADAAGNYTSLLSNVVTIDPGSVVLVEKANLTGSKVVKVYFSDELSKFDAEDVVFTNTTTGLTVAVSSVSLELVKGKTVATFNLASAFAYDAANLKVTTVASPDSSNTYGEKLEGGVTVASINDKLAPALAVHADEDDVKANAISATTGTDPVYTSTVVLTFKEVLNPLYISYASFDVAGYDIVSVVRTSPTVVTITVTGDNYVDLNTAVTLKAPIQDMNENVLSTLETSVTY